MQMRSWLVVLCMALLLIGCASKKNKAKEPLKSSGFASADAKNVHDFLLRYPEVLMRGNVKDIMWLYTDDARIVPFLGNFVRPIRPKDKKQLPAIIAEERKAGMQLTFREPMNIEVKGERASAQVVGEMVWQGNGELHQAVLNCYFGLVRDDQLMWKIREAHGEPVKPGFTLPAQGGSPKKPLPPRDPKLRSLKGRPPVIAKPVETPPTAPPSQTQPAAPAPPPAPQDTGASPQPRSPDGEQSPQPLF